MAKLIANSEDPNQMPHSVASDLGLHCLPTTLLGVSRLQWVKVMLSQILNTAQADLDFHYLHMEKSIFLQDNR